MVRRRRRAARCSAGDTRRPPGELAGASLSVPTAASRYMNRHAPAHDLPFLRRYWPAPEAQKRTLGAARAAAGCRPQIASGELLNRHACCLICWIPGQQGPHEGPLVTEYTAAFVPDAVRFDEVRVGAEQGTVLLIGGETGEAEQRQGLIAGPLGRQEVAVVHAAM